MPPVAGVLNTVSCRCGKVWRFRGHPRGLIVYEKTLLGTWKPHPELWPSTITKFRCTKCGRHMEPR